MHTFLERYLAGEHVQVWRELTELDAQIRQEPLFGEAVAVARETMRRARHNIALLVPRLRRLGYRFEQEPWTPPDPQLRELVAECEAQYGPLPLSLRLWYEEVGTVDLIGYHPRLSDNSSFAPRRAAERPPLSDPLCIWPPDPHLIVDAEENGLDMPVGALLELAPDMCHKGSYSGGGPMSITLPNPAIDGPLLSDDWDGMLLVEYLRQSFAWGGFAGLEGALGADLAQAELAVLTEGLLPL